MLFFRLVTCWTCVPRPLPSPCLLIVTWQLVKAHAVTRNEPNIHVICYITVWKSCLKWWKIERDKKVSGKSVLAAWHDGDDYDIYIYIYIPTHMILILIAGFTMHQLYPLQKDNPPACKKSGVLGMTLNCIWWVGSMNAALGSTVYYFITISRRSTPSLKGNIC